MEHIKFEQISPLLFMFFIIITLINLSNVHVCGEEVTINIEAQHLKNTWMNIEHI